MHNKIECSRKNKRNIKKVFFSLQHKTEFSLSILFNFKGRKKDKPETLF